MSLGSVSYHTAVAAMPPVAASNGTGPAPGDIAALITTMGVTVNGFYDCRTGLTFASGTSQISSWADARGAGFGPPLTQATSARQPTVNSAGSVVTVASAGQNVTSAASALWLANGNITLIYVGAITGGASGLYGAAIADAVSPTTFLGISGASALYVSKAGGVIVQAATTTVADARIRCVVATITGTTPLSAQCPSHAGITTAIATANSAANPTLCCGGFNGGNGNSNGTHRVIIAIPSVLSAGNVTAVLTWAIANHGAISGAVA